MCQLTFPINMLFYQDMQSHSRQEARNQAEKSLTQEILMTVQFQKLSVFLKYSKFLINLLKYSDFKYYQN